MNSVARFDDPVTFAIAVILSIMVVVGWAFLWWHLLSKSGYQGVTRIALLITMVVAPLIGFILYVALPWPLERRFTKLSRRLDEIENSIRFTPMSGNVEAELNRLKTELGLNRMKDPRKRTPW